jgi:hypothetical protein
MKIDSFELFLWKEFHESMYCIITQNNQKAWKAGACFKISDRSRSTFSSDSKIKERTGKRDVPFATKVQSVPQSLRHPTKLPTLFKRK